MHFVKLKIWSKRWLMWGGILAMLISSPSLLAQVPPLLDAASHPKFVNDLPKPIRLNAKKKYKKFHMEMREADQWLGLVDGSGNPMMTTIWGYGVDHKGPWTYPGPTIVAEAPKDVKIKWENELPPYNSGFPGLGGHLLPVDPTLHMAHPVSGGIPTVTHLHGGHTPSSSDGLPEAWFTQDWAEVGPHWQRKYYRYDNDQEAATLWYHDHALGITRLNVYAGLAGFYLLRDKNEKKLIRKDIIPNGDYEIEIVFQDRMFTTDGKLFYPSQDPEMEPGFDPLPPGPSVIAEFFGDFILVNGMTWPKLNVEPRKYRFRLLNGADSRFFILKLSNGQEFMQIGTEDGFLPYPVPVTELLLGPGERADVVVDFTGLPTGTEIVVENLGPDEPFKGFNPDGTLADGGGGALPPADPATTGKLMKFIVDLPLNTSEPNASVDLGTSLRKDDIVPLVQDGATRNLVLFEGLDNYGRLQPLLGTLDEGSMAWFEPITENPMVDDVEIWEVYNATEDAHPIHLHLVAFQIINRESFTGYVDDKPQPMHDGSVGIGGKLTVTGLGGDARPPEPNEAGWKDTAIMLPGEVTRVIAKFDRHGRYVWHCHILSHEDHEMMRPFHVGPLPLPKDGADEETIASVPEKFSLEQNFPNPFNPSTNIRFQLPQDGHVELTIFNTLGQVVKTLANEQLTAGEHTYQWDATDAFGNIVPSGIYFYKMKAGPYTEVKRMLLVR